MTLTVNNTDKVYYESGLYLFVKRKAFGIQRDNDNKSEN